MIKSIGLVLVLLLYTAVITSAQDSISHFHRPRIGLVLSGGGAKGLAHIGVLKVLEEVGMPVDCIAGTSMGSVVGGLYACGYSARQIENITKRINWNEYLLDEIYRKNVSIEEKDDFERYVGEFPLRKGRVVIPVGLVDGQKVSMMLAHFTWPVHNITDFDSLPIPFRCVATDIEKVKPVVLKSGFLPDAIRASMAIPSFFSPIELDGKLLVDGGILRNFPVQDARDMGADIVIGVEVSATLYTKDQLNSVVKIMDQVSSFEAAKSNADQATMCDILIKPDIDKYNLFSFDNIDSLIALGEHAARKILPQLKALADSLRGISHERMQRVVRPEIDSLFIDSIRYEGLDKVSRSLVQGNLELKNKGWISLSELEMGIDRLYGTRFFERVNYKISPNQEGSMLTLRFKEQPFNYFKFSLHYDQYLKTALLLNLTYRNILGDGSRLLLDLRLGQYPGAVAQYSIHTFAHPNVGLSVKVSGNSFIAKFYTPEGLLRENFDVNHYVGEFDFFSSTSKAFMIRTGFQGEIFDVNKTVEVDDTVNLNLDDFSWYARMRFDTQDRTLFPQKGDNFYAEFKYILSSRNFNNFGWDKKFWRFLGNYTKYIPVHPKWVIIPSVNTGLCNTEKVPYPYFNFLGGYLAGETNLFSFDGLKFMAVSGSDILTESLAIRFEPWKNRFITLRNNFAAVSYNLSRLIHNPVEYYSGGISIGMKTMVGPVELTLSRSNLYKSLYAEIRIGYGF